MGRADVSTVGFIEHYPATLHPIDDNGEPTDGESVEVFQLRPGDVERLTVWTGITGYAGADGGVLLLDAGQVIGTVRLGQFVVRDAAGLRVETSAPDLFRAYQPAD